jgi:hypothetical protein
MTAQFGVNPEGFRAKTLRDIMSDLEVDQRSRIDPQLDLSSKTIMGQCNGINARQGALVWEVARLCYHAIDPNYAENDMLDNVCALTGTTRDGESYSYVTQTVVVELGSQLNTGEAWVSRSDRPDVRFTPDQDFEAETAGSFDVLFRSETTGPVEAPAGTLTVVASAVIGWTSTTNAEDATPGSLVEDDPHLRLKRDQEVAAPGSGTFDAMRVDVENALEGAAGAPSTLDVTILENSTLTTDSNGVPMLSFETVIDDDGLIANNTIAQAIWDSKPTNSHPVGDLSGTALDDNGDDQTIPFSRPSALNIYLTYDLTVDADTYVGDAAFKAAIAARCADEYGSGEDVLAMRVGGFALDQGGVTNARLKLGTAASPTLFDDIPVAARQRARFADVRIVVNIL